MHKIFFGFFLLTVLFFPISRAFAQACEPTCPNLTSVGADGNCYANDGGDTRPLPITGVSCVSHPGTTPSNSDPGGIDSCICQPDGSCKPGDKNCTSAVGQPCSEGITSGSGINTAIGCVPTEPKALIEGILKFGTLAAGGVAFLLMLLGALQMITAEGNPESIKQAQERFYSAIIGLLLIIFAVLLMQVIGVDILGLPGLGTQPPAFNTSRGDSS